MSSAALPIISGREAVHAFEKAGWIVARRRASHIILIKRGVPVNLSIPDHKQLDRGLLRSQIRKAGLTVDEFVALLRDQVPPSECGIPMPTASAERHHPPWASPQVCRRFLPKSSGRQAGAPTP
jgi:predicted RNA binding protein YcfA (HicA-like mRNA interferase family)